MATLPTTLTTIERRRSSIYVDRRVVGCDDNGWPDFHALQRRAADHCVWAFDLLWHEREHLCALPLIDRRRRLASVIKRAALPCLRFSEAFDDRIALLVAADRMGLEGIVSKRVPGIYRAGIRSGWIK